MNLMSSQEAIANDHLSRCLDLCRQCHEVCLATLAYCLRTGGDHAQEQHLRLMMDCAEICQTSANLMLRESGFHARTCGLCAEVCESCADACGKFESDATMQQCADLCRDCAAACREISVEGSA